MAGGRGQYQLKPYRVIYAGVEGASEQAFLKWIERLCDDRDIRVRFKIQNCNGGSPKQIVGETVKVRPTRALAINSIILLDKDRLSDHEERELQQLADKQKITLIIQRPNFEGIMLRLNPGEEPKQPPPEAVKIMLRKFWQDYEKPPAARELAARFGFENLEALARYDEDLATLLRLVGLKA